MVSPAHTICDERGDERAGAPRWGAQASGAATPRATSALLPRTRRHPMPTNSVHDADDVTHLGHIMNTNHRSAMPCRDGRSTRRAPYTIINRFVQHLPHKRFA